MPCARECGCPCADPIPAFGSVGAQHPTALAHEAGDRGGTNSPRAAKANLLACAGLRSGWRLALLGAPHLLEPSPRFGICGWSRLAWKAHILAGEIPWVTDFLVLDDCPALHRR